jgi:hypothetical protein
VIRCPIDAEWRSIHQEPFALSLSKCLRAQGFDRLSANGSCVFESGLA